MKTEEFTEDLTYADKEPEVEVLVRAYDETTNNLQFYYDLCTLSYEERHNSWAGRLHDMKKSGADAFPWKGAADMQAHTIAIAMNRLVSLLMMALARANIRAYPVNTKDLERSEMVSGFMRWMRQSGYISHLKAEQELGANFFLERGLLVTYVGWKREDRSFLQKLDLEQIAQVSPQIAEMVMSGQNDEEVVAMLQTVFPKLKRRKAKQALRRLQRNGEAEIPVVRRQVDAPEVKTLAPDGAFIFPSWVSDPQQAPYCFWRTYYTPQELLGKVQTDGWDEGWVDYCIEYFRGKDVDIDQPEDGIARRTFNGTGNPAELIEVVHGYQRLIHPDDGSEGIYETVFHRRFSGDDYTRGYAKYELLNGYEDYPVVVTRLDDFSQRMYDVDTIPNLIRGIQRLIKVERDSRINRNSMATLPPLLYRVGPQPPPEYGPGAKIPVRQKDDITFGPQPEYNEGSIEIEQIFQRQADLITGLDEDPFSMVRRQHLTDKFLKHWAEVFKKCFENFQRFGPDEIYFQVTGAPDPVRFTKGNPDEKYDVMVQFDVQSTDPEYQEKKIKALIELSQYDRSGQIDMEALLARMAAMIDPVLADSVLQPTQQAADNLKEEVTGDLSRIYAGMEVGARKTGAQLALQIIQQYVQQPDIQQRLQEDEGFKTRLEKYAGQYQFALQQTQNAEIGRIGTSPASVGDVSTQNMIS
jgi:hypothetical protein